VVGAVIWVEHARHVFRLVLGLHGLHVVALVEGVQVDAGGGACGPQAQGGHAAEFVAGHAAVIGGGNHVIGVHPVHLVAHLHQPPAVAHGVADFRAHELPRIAVDQPVVGFFHLAAAHDALGKHAVVVPDAIAHAGNAQRGHRVQKTRGQPTQAAVAQARVGFQVNQGVKVGAELGAGGFGIVVNAH